MDKSACMIRGEAALRSMGYSPTLTSVSVWGEGSEVTLVVRCDNPGFLIFAVSYHGKPNAEQNTVLDRLSDQF
jgi:hypothetical protein